MSNRLTVYPGRFGGVDSWGGPVVEFLVYRSIAVIAEESRKNRLVTKAAHLAQSSCISKRQLLACWCGPGSILRRMSSWFCRKGWIITGAAMLIVSDYWFCGGELLVSDGQETLYIPLRDPAMGW